MVITKIGPCCKNKDSNNKLSKSYWMRTSYFKTIAFGLMGGCQLILYTFSSTSISIGPTILSASGCLSVLAWAAAQFDLIDVLLFSGSAQLPPNSSGVHAQI